FALFLNIRKSVTNSMKDADKLLSKAVINYEFHNIEKSSTYFKKALSIKNIDQIFSSICLFALSKNYYLTCQYKKALHSINESINLLANQDFPLENIQRNKSLLFKVKILEKLEEEKADIVFESIKSKDLLESWESYKIRIQLFLSRGDTLKAMKDINYVASKKKTISIYYPLSIYYYEKNLLDKGIAILNTAINIGLNEEFSKGSRFADDFTNLYLLLSLIYYDKNDNYNAITNFQKALEVSDFFTGNYEKWFKYRELPKGSVEKLMKIKNLTKE
ncbi:MAG: hypothetical protein K8S23_00015, partial [Candidatus Cloacimonetes bacterium]|nr:hypothetical protein [Candidatus Cloacimonadota bacterium]